VKVFQTSWNPSEGEVMQAYIHGQTEKGSGIGKIGTVVHLSREDNKANEALDKMATQLAMHIAAMKPTFLREEDIPESVKAEILAGENGERALKKYIKRDVMWKQELATASEGSDTVGKFLSGKAKQMKTNIEVENWALFMIA
jgi:translation elongation factor EF-Ts